MPYIDIVREYSKKNHFEYNHEELFNQVREAMTKSGAERAQALQTVLKTNFRADAEKYEPVRKKMMVDAQSANAMQSAAIDFELRKMADPCAFLEEYTNMINAMAKDIDETYEPAFMLGMNAREAKNLVSDQLNVFNRLEETMYVLKRDGWERALELVEQSRYSRTNQAVRNYATEDEENRLGMMDVFMRKECVKKELNAMGFFRKYFSAEGRSMRNYVKVAEQTLKEVQFPKIAEKEAEAEFAQTSISEKFYEKSYMIMDAKFKHNESVRNAETLNSREKLLIKDLESDAKTNEVSSKYENNPKIEIQVKK